MRFATNIAVIMLVVASFGLNFADEADLLPCADGDGFAVAAQTVVPLVKATAATAPRSHRPHAPSTPRHCGAASPLANAIPGVSPVLVHRLELASRIAPPRGERVSGVTTLPLVKPPKIQS
jgi:hypothetical protein